MTDREVKRLTPNSIANLLMADEAWHDSLYVKAEDYDSLLADFEALRTALAAEQPKPERGRDWDDGVLEGRLREREYWLAQHTAPPAAAPEPVRHPGYVIGNHWLETAYSRVCAGEAEADVLRDCGWERVTDAEALRRDAESWRRLMSGVGSLDADMEDKT